MAKFLEILSNPSVRRFVVTLITMGTVALNKKLGLDLDPNHLFDLCIVGLGYVGQSAAREAVVAHADAKVAASDNLRAVAEAGKTSPPPA